VDSKNSFQPNGAEPFAAATPAKLAEAITRLLHVLRQVSELLPSNGMTQELDAHRALRAKEAWVITGDKRSHFYARLNVKSPSHDPTFPRPFYLNRSPRFWQHELIQWLKAKAAATPKEGLA